MRGRFNFFVWAQRLDMNGISMWTLIGVPAGSWSFRVKFPVVISDGAAGAIVPRLHGRGGVYAQRLNQNDEAQWTPNGSESSSTFTRLRKEGTRWSVMAAEGRSWPELMAVSLRMPTSIHGELALRSRINGETEAYRSSRDVTVRRNRRIAPVRRELLLCAKGIV